MVAFGQLTSARNMNKDKRVLTHFTLIPILKAVVLHTKTTVLKYVMKDWLAEVLLNNEYYRRNIAID